MSSKILIVEDDLDALKLIGLSIEVKGYQILAAKNGEQALEKAFKEQPDLVILDVMMPGMNGLEVARRLRSDPRTETIPIMMLSALGHVSDKEAGFKAGADEYLTKPIPAPELAMRVEALLARASRLSSTPQLTMRAKVFGILGCRGGVGTSTVAVNTGVAMAQGPASRQDVMLVEFRTGLSTLGLQLGLPVREGIVKLVEQPANSLDVDSIRAQMERHQAGLMVLASEPVPIGVHSPVDEEYVTAIIRQLGSVADYILVDMGSDLGEANQAVLKFVDYVLLVVEPKRIGLTLAQSMLAGLEQLNVGRHLIGIVVLHQAPAAIVFTNEMVGNFLQQEVKATVSPVPELAFQAAEQGVPIVSLQPGNLVSTQFSDLAEFLTSV
jgi:CheY-like chemotaxis protein